MEQSPSSRRAWIEINCIYRRSDTVQEVALLAEGVDRNAQRIPVLEEKMKVALLAEGVDRN